MSLCFTSSCEIRTTTCWQMKMFRSACAVRCCVIFRHIWWKKSWRWWGRMQNVRLWLFICQSWKYFVSFAGHNNPFDQVQYACPLSVWFFRPWDCQVTESRDIRLYSVCTLATKQSRIESSGIHSVVVEARKGLGDIGELSALYQHGTNLTSE